jgi:hypothetical protein
VDDDRPDKIWNGITLWMMISWTDNKPGKIGNDGLDGVDDNRSD